MSDPVIHFGTDGWRGKIADDYTFSSVRRCAHGFARFLKERGTGDSVVVGYDKRFNSEGFAAAAAEVLAGNGLHVLLTEGPTPTPAISFSVVARNAAGAVNITASHNPATDNGFKVRDEHGGAVSPEGLTTIESYIPADSNSIPSIPIEEAKADGQVEVFDAAPLYFKQIQTLIDLEPIKAAGLTVLYDPMWGNGAGWFSKLLEGGRTRIISIHDRRNPIFPEMGRPEPIRPNIDPGLRATLKEGADVLIVNDGDADRVGLGDEHGEFVDQLRVFALLAYYMLEVRR